METRDYNSMLDLPINLKAHLNIRTWFKIICFQDFKHNQVHTILTITVAASQFISTVSKFHVQPVAQVNNI